MKFIIKITALLWLAIGCTPDGRGRRASDTSTSTPYSGDDAWGSQGTLLDDAKGSALPTVSVFLEEEDGSFERFYLQAPDPLRGRPGDYTLSWLAEYPMKEVTLSGFGSLDSGEYKYAYVDGVELVVDFAGTVYRGSACPPDPPELTVQLGFNDPMNGHFSSQVCSPTGASLRAYCDFSNLPRP